MGVHGLTEYVRQRRTTLAQTLELPVQPDPRAEATQIVVDGLSFLYVLVQHSRLPWVFGGEYGQLAAAIESTVIAWLSVGIEPSFVFDGPSEPIKFATRASRLTSNNILHSQLFFRTSAVSRASPRFLAESRILPPLVYNTLVTTLQKLQTENHPVSIFFADREADPFAVELAGRLGAYVAALDSDFVVLQSPGYLGYAPLDEFVWTTGTIDDTEEIDGDFHSVNRKKGKRSDALSNARSLIPPPDISTLSISIYSPESVAKSLGVTQPLMPILGAIVGNDFFHKVSHTSLIFERKLGAVQRVIYTANTLRTVLEKAKKAGGRGPRTVLDLIRTAITQMLLRPATTSSGDVDNVVSMVVESALQYAILPAPSESLWPTPFCPLHEDLGLCKLPPLTEDSDPSKHQVQEVLTTAYRDGKLGPQILEIFITGNCWPRMFLENPDLETFVRILGRPLRLWSYFLLDDAIGIPISSDDDSEDGSSRREETEGSIGTVTASAIDGLDDDDDDDDEIIDVMDEDDESPIAILQDTLHKLRGQSEQGCLPGKPAVHLEHQPSQPESKCVVEHLRKGSRLAAESVILLPQSHFYDILQQVNTSTPIILQSLAVRTGLLLKAAGSDITSVRQLPCSEIFSVLVCRWILRSMSERVSHSPVTSMWTRREMWALLVTFAPSSSSASGDTGENEASIHERSIWLMSQVLATIEPLWWLIQILQLGEHFPFNLTKFNGSLFHALLATGQPKEPPEGAAWAAVEDGLEATLREEKYEAKRKRAKQNPAPAKAAPSLKLRGGFHLLAGMDA